MTWDHNKRLEDIKAGQITMDDKQLVEIYKADGLHRLADALEKIADNIQSFNFWKE